METTPFLLKEFKAFTLNTTVEKAKVVFGESGYSHFPIVEKGLLLGLIAHSDVQGIDDSNKELRSIEHLFTYFHLEVTSNLLEFLNVFASNESNIIPAINEKREYLGYFDLIDILHIYNNSPFLKNEGVIIHIEKGVKDYSFSQISQIVESHNGSILGLFIADSRDNTIRLTLKFNAPDINEIIQSFRRYDYIILSKHEDDNYLEDLKDRSDYLQKYLNI